MEHNTFQKVKKIKKRMYGPEKLLVCGYTAAEHENLLAFLEQCGLKKIPVVFVADKDRDVTLTAISEGWSIGFLLQELEKEAEAMRKIRKK